MTISFKSVFNPNMDFIKEKLTNQSPCDSCEEQKQFLNNPYYQSSECNHCARYVLWVDKCIRKLAYLESEKEK